MIIICSLIMYIKVKFRILSFLYFLFKTNVFRCKNSENDQQNKELDKPTERIRKGSLEEKFDNKKIKKLEKSEEIGQRKSRRKIKRKEN